LLQIYNVGMEEVRGETKGKQYQGLVYFALDKNGEKAGTPFKSSLFGKNVGIEALEKHIKKSTETIKDKKLKDRSKKIIAAAMRTCKTRAVFEKALQKQGISVLFRINDEGRIYGVTFIDHENKVVLNGSRLGKEFSANKFHELFGEIKEQREEQREQQEPQEEQREQEERQEQEEQQDHQEDEPQEEQEDGQDDDFDYEDQDDDEQEVNPLTPSTPSNSYETTDSNGFFNIFSPSNSTGDEIEEAALTRRMKKKRKKRIK